MLAAVIEELEKLSEWNHDGIHDCLIGLAQRLEVKNGTVMWPARISVSGKRLHQAARSRFSIFSAKRNPSKE